MFLRGRLWNLWLYSSTMLPEIDQKKLDAVSL